MMRPLLVALIATPVAGFTLFAARTARTERRASHERMMTTLPGDPSLDMTTLPGDPSLILTTNAALDDKAGFVAAASKAIATALSKET